jgi:hypothetical protein
MNHYLLLAALAFASVAFAGRTDYDSGMPFGKVVAADIDRLQGFAKSKGVNIVADMQLAYAKDEEALGRVFAFSLQFASLDKNARAYGQIIYSSFLNLAEANGIEHYSRLVEWQPDPVRQRIRDFIFFGATQAPKEVRESVERDTREGAPLLFPKDYVFGKDNPVFRSGKPGATDSPDGAQ